MNTAVETDTVDVREIFSVLRRRWWWVAAGAITGLLLAGAAILLLRPRYESSATVLLRSGADPATLGGSSSRGEGGISLGGLADMLSVATGFETEMEILTSRSVVEAAVDSLRMQATVLAPRGRTAASLFGRLVVPRNFEPATYTFTAEGGKYRVRGGETDAMVSPGSAADLDGAVLFLRPAAELPPEFTIELASLQTAVERVREILEAEQAGGDIAELRFRAGDPVTSAALPNALVAIYLARRRTTDRGVNQHRYEFLTVHTDSINTELLAAEGRLRRQQEQSGVLDPAVYGKAELEQGLELRAELEAADVERRAFEEVVRQAKAGDLSPRDLAAYPTFLKNEAINDLLSQLIALDTRQADLLERRTPRDPDVMVVARQIELLEEQLVALSTAYLSGLNRQQTQLQRELGRYQEVLAALPAQAEAGYRAQREVVRLSETAAALQTQLVQARLAAITEGGDVRLIDPAVPPEEPVFPQPLLFLALGLLVGSMLGVAVALGRFYLGDRVQDLRDAELAAGVPAVAFDNRIPLLVGAADGDARTVLIVPLGPAARSVAVARRIAASASHRGQDVVLLELTGADPLPEGALPPAAQAGASDFGGSTAVVAVRPQRVEGASLPVYRGNGTSPDPLHSRHAVEELERSHSLVIAALPGLGEMPTPALLAPGRVAVLVAAAGDTRRSEVAEAVAALTRLGISVAGLVLVNGKRGNDVATR